MRVTRNYRSGMVNFRKNTNKQKASLLQSALSRSSKNGQASRLAALLGIKNNGGASNVSNRDFANSTSKSQKFYYDMQYHANRVEAYGDALKSSQKNSLYDKARESGSTEQIVSNIKDFVNQYNNMLSDLKESGTRTDTVNLTQLNSMTRAAENNLASTGVTRKSDGTLVIDEEKLAAADVDTLEKVWGGSNGFVSRAAAKAGSIKKTAEQNIEAEKSSIYNPFDRTNLYGSSTSSIGNYFNYRR